jgi:hypothetical protein
MGKPPMPAAEFSRMLGERLGLQEVNGVTIVPAEAPPFDELDSRDAVAGGFGGASGVPNSDSKSEGAAGAVRRRGAGGDILP